METDWRRVSDDELLRRARREPDAFAAFYSRHERLVLGFFLGRVGDAEVAADLAAETFAAALSAIPRSRCGRPAGQPRDRAAAAGHELVRGEPERSRRTARPD